MKASYEELRKYLEKSESEIGNIIREEINAKEFTSENEEWLHELLENRKHVAEECAKYEKATK